MTSSTVEDWVYRIGSALLAVGFISRLLGGDRTLSAVCLGAGCVLVVPAIVFALVRTEREGRWP